jgi:hypothetical protein
MHGAGLESHRLGGAPVIGPRGDAQPYLIGLRTSVPFSMHARDANQIDPRLIEDEPSVTQPLQHHFCSQARPSYSIDPCVRDLAFADVTIQVTDRDLVG